MQGTFEEAARLLGRAVGPLPFEPAFAPLAAGAAPHAVAAVDGSHAVLLDTGAAWVVAATAEAVRWPGPPGTAQRPEVVAALAEDAQERLDALHAASGLEAPRVRSAESFAQAWRALRETEAALRAAASLPPDGLLLLDGALHGLPPGPAAAARLVLAAAGPRSVAAVAKRTRLAAAGRPLVAALWERGARELPGQAWSTPTPGIAGSHVCRLHAASPHAFRVDRHGPATLPALAALCRDAAYPGYPYPLAVAHNRVALTAARVADLKAGLESAVRRHGARASRAAADPHALLDRGVPS